MTTISNPAEMLRGFQASWNADRFGVFASVLCAIHCAATPFLLLILPTFGKVWSHPASHWLMALIVVPIALLMVSKGYQRHRRKWIIAIGILGILFVLVGAVTPYFEKIGTPQAQPPTTATSSNPAAIMASSTSENETSCEASCEESSSCEEGDSSDEGSGCQEIATSGETNGEATATGCVDSCCPSLVVQADGSKSLHIPLASILTTIGGLFLIVTHIGNLCQCACCQKDDKAGISETSVSSFT